MRAINDLKPVIGLELTATPFVETGKGPVAFKNVIYDYPLGKAMEDGFVKEPAKGQFQIIYRDGADHLEYQPDFIAEVADNIYMLEPKARSEIDDPIVQAKKQVAVKWCGYASDHAASYGGKQWRYVLIPHDAIAENMTLAGLADCFGD